MSPAINPEPNQVPGHHVIVGAGATGTATARLLSDQGHRVTMISRSGRGPVEPGIELVAADAANSGTLTELTVGAAAIYNCANPQYTDWARDWPPLANPLLPAAAANAAVLVTQQLFTEANVFDAEVSLANIIGR